jgi:hypothetical protein
VVDLLENASAWLAGRRTKFLSRPVTYCRGADSVAVQATVGKTVFEVDDGSGVLETFESRDYLVAAANLVLGGAAVKPQRGDRITDGGKVYEVMAPGKEDVFRFSDPYGVTLRIHTKQVDTV